ncbi:MAG: hypothetical protein KDH96_09000 [Candidatus Riesia sp.]|nr:hypothetical protein [Candidatus Riesia sp.]
MLDEIRRLRNRPNGLVGKMRPVSYELVLEAFAKLRSPKEAVVLEDRGRLVFEWIHDGDCMRLEIEDCANDIFYVLKVGDSPAVGGWRLGPESVFPRRMKASGWRVRA